MMAKLHCVLLLTNMNLSTPGRGYFHPLIFAILVSFVARGSWALERGLY